MCPLDFTSNMPTKIYPLTMSTRIHCPWELSIPLPWAGEIVLICHSFSAVLSCRVTKNLVMFCQFIQNWSWSDTWGEILFARIENSNSWSSIWNSNLRWNLTSMFYLSFRPCCQTREIFAILNEIVHEFEWGKGQKVSKTNFLYLTSFNKLTKIFCPIRRRP